MTDTTVKKWTLLHGELVREHDGPLVWSADYDALAAKLADAERVARYESDIAEQALDQMRAAEQRVATLEAALPAVYRLALADAVGSTLAQQARCEEQTMKLGGVEGRESDWHRWNGGVLSLGLSASIIRALPTPTAAELMARIHTGEKQ